MIGWWKRRKERKRAEHFRLARAQALVMMGPPFDWRQRARAKASLLVPFGYEIINADLLPDWVVMLLGPVGGKTSVVWIDAKEDCVKVYPAPLDMESLISQCRPWQGKSSPSSSGEDDHGQKEKSSQGVEEEVPGKEEGSAQGGSSQEEEGHQEGGEESQAEGQSGEGS